MTDWMYFTLILYKVTVQWHTMGDCDCRLLAVV